MNKLTLRLTYVNENGTLKVNKMESIILTDQTGDYGILDNTTTSSEETESSSEDTSASENSTESSTEKDAS